MHTGTTDMPFDSSRTGYSNCSKENVPATEATEVKDVAKLTIQLTNCPHAQ
jgi:hypothetical protein